MVAFGTVIKDASISGCPKATLRFGSRGPKFESWYPDKKDKVFTEWCLPLCFCFWMRVFLSVFCRKLSTKPHIKQNRMSGLTIYGYSKITGVNRVTLRAWLMNHPGNDSDMVSCSLSHEEEIFMNKDKNSRADSDLSAAVCASAGASNPGDLSSPRIEYIMQCGKRLL